MMYVVRDREAGNVITQFETMGEAQKELEKYEEQDKKDGTYTEDFYEIAVIDQIKEVHIMKIWKNEKMTMVTGDAKVKIIQKS